MELVHTGMMSGGWGRDPEPLFCALRRLLDERPGLGDRLRLTLAGNLEERDARLIAEADLGAVVSHVGRLPRAESVALQRRASALVLVTSRHSGEATGKLFEYLARGGRSWRSAGATRPPGSSPRRERAWRSTRPTTPDSSRCAPPWSGTLPYAPRGLDAYRYPAPAERVAELAEPAVAGRRGA